jgi:hypothetical protein
VIQEDHLMSQKETKIICLHNFIRLVHIIILMNQAPLSFDLTSKSTN